MTVVRKVLRLNENPPAEKIWPSIREWLEEWCGENPRMLRWLQKSSGIPGTTSARHGGAALSLVAVDGSLAVMAEDARTVTSIVAAPDAQSRMELSFELEATSPERTDRERAEGAHISFFRHLDRHLGKPERSDAPVNLDDMNLETLAKVMKCEARLPRPLVYVSMNDGNQYDIDPDGIARRLQYLAVVVRESDRASSSQLRDMTGSRKPFNGFVGVYWERKCGIFSPRSEDRLVQEIMRLTTLTRLPGHLSWTDINSRWVQQQLQRHQQGQSESRQATLYQGRIQELERELGRKCRELEEYIENFSDPDSGLLNENIRLSQEVAALRSGQAVRMGGGISVSLESTEGELFPGEIIDFVGGIIWEYLKKHHDTTEESRHAHVVRSLYDNNRHLNFEGTESYKHYRQTERQIKQGEPELPLYRLKPSKRGKHRKYLFCDDGRYILTIAKTGSDRRETDNAVSDAGNHFLEPRK